MRRVNNFGLRIKETATKGNLDEVKRSLLSAVIRSERQ